MLDVVPVTTFVKSVILKLWELMPEKPTPADCSKTQTVLAGIALFLTQICILVRGYKICSAEAAVKVVTLIALF